MTEAGPTEASGQTGGDPKPGGEGTGVSSKPGSEGSGATRTFTQDQVDRFVAEARQREIARFGDYDSIKSKLTELEQQGQTELERAQAQAKDADTRASEATAQRNRLLVQSAVTSAAARAGALDPDIVVALLSDSITVDDKGAIDGDVAGLVAKLLDDKPFLRANGATPGVGSADQGAHSPRQTPASTPSQAMDNALRTARGGA
jgi:hypothetical protein